jgi:hypothetical protein
MFPVFSIQRVKELIEGAGKQREVWEVFVPQASGFDETPHSFADTHSFAIRSNKPPPTEVISKEQ